MPTRTYEGIDFVNYLASFDYNSGDDTALLSPTNQFNFVISSSGINGPNPAGYRNLVGYLYIVTADLDFDVFPAVPEDASITEVEVRIDISVSATASASSSNTVAPNPCTSGGVFRGKIYIDNGVDPPEELTDISFEEIDEDMSSGPGAISSSASGFDHYTAFQEFPFPGGITKLALEAQFTHWILTLQGAWGAGADTASDPGSTGSTSENSGFSFDGIRVTVTYEGGSFTHTMTPNTSDPGGTITVSPNTEGLTIALITDSGRVVPIEPKPDGFETPYPPTEDCTGCFGECPECDTCATACAEDLEGEECQACMQACLDCLTACLEDLELAEACHESAPPGPTTVIITGTQFSGSVVLGELEILEAEGSGIYRFIPNQRHDSLYASARDGTTYDVKIPNPSAKTGFFRS